MNKEHEVGDFVIFKTEDSYYAGHIVSIFNKIIYDGVVPDPMTQLGPVRWVVQNTNGLLLIKNPKYVFKRKDIR